MIEFRGAQSSVQGQEAQLVNCKGIQPNMRLLCHFPGLVEYILLGNWLVCTVPITHGASIEVWGGLTRTEHLNFNSYVT